MSSFGPLPKRPRCEHDEWKDACRICTPTYYDLRCRVEEVEAENARLQKEKEDHRNAEILWETTMMKLVEEDGVGSVRDKIIAIQAENARLNKALNDMKMITLLIIGCIEDTDNRDMAMDLLDKKLEECGK